MPAKPKPKEGAGEKKGVILKVSPSSVPFLCNWINALLQQRINPSLPPDDNKSFFSELKNGLLLCRLCESLITDQATLEPLKGVNKKPLTQQPCMKNLEIALGCIWKRHPTASNMCNAKDMYEGKDAVITRCMLETFRCLQMPPLKQHAKESLSDINNGLSLINRPLSPETLDLVDKPGTRLREDFDDGVRVVGMLVLRGKMKPPSMSNFWGNPSTKEQRLENVTLLGQALDAARVDNILSPQDWLQPPDPSPDTLLYMIDHIRQRLKITAECWQKDMPKDLSQFTFKDGVPLIGTGESPVRTLREPLDDDDMSSSGAQHQEYEPSERRTSQSQASQPGRSTDRRRSSAVMSSGAPRSSIAQRKSLQVREMTSEIPDVEKQRAANARRQSVLAQQQQQQSRRSIAEQPSPSISVSSPQQTTRPTPKKGRNAGGQASLAAPGRAQEERGSMIPPASGRGDGRSPRPQTSISAGGSNVLRQQEEQRLLEEEEARYQKAKYRNPKSKPDDNLCGEFLEKIDVMMKRIDSRAAGQHWPAHWHRNQPRPRITEDFEWVDKPGIHAVRGGEAPEHKQKWPVWEHMGDLDSWVQTDRVLPYGDEVDRLHREDIRRCYETALAPAPNLLATRSGNPRGPGMLSAPDLQDPMSMSKDVQKVTPTTYIDADVVCQDGSTWAAEIQTNVVDGPARADGAESPSKFVLEFRAVADPRKRLRMRADVSFILDVKTTPEGTSGEPSYFLLISPGGVLAGTAEDGMQALPDESASVVHVSPARSARDARNFFAELLILAQFLSSTHLMPS